jgi:parvulin-like peptidyl-prolyl isomerase
MRTIASSLLALLVAIPSAAQAPAPPAPPRAAEASPRPVARVGQLRIGYDELDRQEREALQLYRDRNRTDVAPELVPAVRRQVLENLIRQRLLALDARQRGVTVSDAEAEAQLRRDPAFQQDGLFNEARYLAIKAAQPERYAQALAATRDAIAARKAAERMERETRPDDATMRADLERELSRATLEFLALRRRDFDGTVPEPREDEVLAHYRANAERYRRPEEATLGMVVFNRPPAGDSIGATAAGYRAWEQRMRARADSALAAVRAGVRFDEVAIREGGVKTVTLRRDRAPELWRGGPREVAAVFAAAPGTLLPEPVRAAPGWALVRVESVRPSRIASLREVSREIRRELRAAARARAEERLVQEVYASAGDSLRGPAVRLRFALADTASFAPGEPALRELDRWYRAHLADYTTYDRASNTVTETPFARVQDDVRRRWMRERRRELARVAAERLGESWSRGRRDPALERTMTLVREPGVIPAAAPPDTGRLGAAVLNALEARQGRPGVSVTPIDGGFVVLHLIERLEGHLPTLEQARPLLAARIAARRQAALTSEARRRFDADSSRYRSAPVVQFSRLIVEPPLTLDVPLTRDEVERYFRGHLNKYSVEELARVRHILIATSGPGALSDAQARDKAESLLARLRAGEDFSRLAAEHSDDLATKLNGGDVGVFRRGMMRDAFERAAFAMRPGDLAGPIRTEVGYHIMECLEYLPPIFPPLAEVYGNVAFDCAVEKSKQIAADRADSLYRALKSIPQAKAAAARLGFEILPTSHEVGRTGRFDDVLLPYILKVEKLKPGEFYPGVQVYEGLGPVISWVDDITPGRPLAWEEARDRVVDDYRAELNLGAVRAKRAELDSMFAAGWSFDSLATLWGGLERLDEVEMGTTLTGMGGRSLLDSLAFGAGGRPPIETGRVTDWVEFPGGPVRLRVVERITPDPDDFARRLEQRRQVVLWRNLKGYFDRLKARYPVEILDGELRSTALLEPTES